MTLAPLSEPWSCSSQPNLLAATGQRRYAIKRSASLRNAKACQRRISALRKGKNVPPSSNRRVPHPFRTLCRRKSARRGRQSIRLGIVCAKIARLSGGSVHAQRDILPACSPVRVMVEQSWTERSQVHDSTNRGNLSTAESDEGD